MKYIITENGPVIFDVRYAHNEIAGRMHPTSAGFVQFEVQRGEILAKCYGKSISLNLKPDLKNDERKLTQLVNKML